ncbi:MAG: TIGR02594 family protein [Pseudomonadota bacterium]
MQQPIQQPWMDHAWALYGAREVRGSGSNPKVVDLYRDSGHRRIRDDGVPWCAAFVGACLERGGLDGTGSLMARSYMRWGRAVSQAEYGAVAVFSRGGDPSKGHVGFVVGADAKRIFLLGGNQSDAVNVRAYPKSRLLAFRLPSHTIAVKPVEASPAFDACLPHVLKMEGGYSNDPHDPGGPTNKGITLATFARHRRITVTDRTRSKLVRDLKVIPDAVVRDIYRDRYWVPARADDMPLGVDLMHFDASVNHGRFGAAKLLQDALGVTRDGEIGPITMAALKAANPDHLIRLYAEARRRRYRALHHFWRFGRGWLRRTDRTEAAALKRSEAAVARPADGRNLESPAVGDTTSPTPKPAKSGVPKMTSPTAPTTGEPKKWWMQSITLWGAFVTTLSTVLPIVGPLFGVQLSADMIEQIGQHVITVLQALGGISGVLMTVFGRVRAETRLVSRSGS